MAVGEESYTTWLSVDSKRAEEVWVAPGAGEVFTPTTQLFEPAAYERYVEHVAPAAARMPDLVAATVSACLEVSKRFSLRFLEGTPANPRRRRQQFLYAGAPSRSNTEYDDNDDRVGEWKDMWVASEVLAWSLMTQRNLAVYNDNMDKLFRSFQQNIGTNPEPALDAMACHIRNFTKTLVRAQRFANHCAREFANPQPPRL